ncbi:MAG: hypothetical protein ACU837_11845 [Gammaproteobacteria bacterium]
MFEQKNTNIDNKPSWRFSTVDKNGPFAWPTGKPEELEIVGKLHSFDSMTWSDIEGADHHSISISKLSKEAQKRLQEIKQDDIDEFFSFRMQGKPRIICIRDRNIAKLLWFDPNHQVCPSTKKHT